MLSSALGYFFSVITFFAGVITFMALLIGVLDNSTFEKLRRYPRPIIERAAPPNQEPHHTRNWKLHHTLVARGTDDATAKHLSASNKNTKDSRAVSSAKADAENRKPEIRPELGLDGLVVGWATYAVGSVLTALAPQLRPVSSADNQSAAPASQQKPDLGSTPLPQSILAAKPLGPASQFQPPSATPAQAASGIAQQPGAQPQNNQPPSNQARGNQAPGTQQQLATPAQQQTAPQVSTTPGPYAATANDDDRPVASRPVRHARHKQATFTSNVPRYRDENSAPRYGPDQYGAWSDDTTQRFDARGYDRVYNSYGEPRFGPDARYRRSRVIPRSPETIYPPMQTGPPRREQYWGGFIGGYRYGD